MISYTLNRYCNFCASKKYTASIGEKNKSNEGTHISRTGFGICLCAFLFYSEIFAQKKIKL